MANGEKARYDKAKNGWNRDWETDNIPDDTTSDGCDCQPIEFEEGTRHHVDCALRREQPQVSRPQESSFINWADEASEGGEKPSQAAASTRSGIGAREFLDNYQDAWVLSISENGKNAIAAFAEAYAADQVRQAEAKWRNWGIVEVAVRNPQVAAYCKHWESRTCSAEAEAAQLRQERDAYTKQCQSGTDAIIELTNASVRREREARERAEGALREAREQIATSCEVVKDLNALKSSQEEANDPHPPSAPAGGARDDRDYWKSRAETAELKVLTFNEAIAQLRQERDALQRELKVVRDFEASTIETMHVFAHKLREAISDGLDPMNSLIELERMYALRGQR